MSCTDGPMHILIDIGADAIKEYELQSDGAAVDLTGATFTCRGRTSRSSSTVIWTAVVTLDADPTTGRITISIDDAVTASIAPSRGVWDLTMTLGDVTVPITDGTWSAQLRVSR